MSSDRRRGPHDTYDEEPEGEATGEDAKWIEEMTAGMGAVVGGRWTYEAARHWGDGNPWGVPFFIVTHRPDEQPEGDAFVFVAAVEEAIDRAREAAGDKKVHVMGGAQVIRQALAADLVDELTIIVAPRSLELEHTRVGQSPFATFVHYRVKR